MALIEKIEIKALTQAIKNPFLYLTFAVMSLPLLFVQTELNLVVLALLALVFSVILVVDAKEYIIPDSMQFATFILALFLIYYSTDKSWLESVIGMGFAGLIFGGIYYVYEAIIKRSALGFGDVKLFANVGFLLGLFSFNYFLWVLTLTSGLFLIFRLFSKENKKLIPYGPFIVISAWSCLLFENFFDELNIKLMSWIFS